MKRPSWSDISPRIGELVRLVPAALFAVSLAPSSAAAQAPAQGDVFASSSRACGFPNHRVDMDRIVEAARGYPNPRIYLLTPAEKTAMEREIAAWNEAHRDAGVGMAPCFTCSRDYEACIVYQRFGETFASSGGRPGEEFGSTGGGGGRNSEKSSTSDTNRSDRTRAPRTREPMPRCRDQVDVLTFDTAGHQGLSYARRPGGGGRPRTLDVRIAGGAEQGMSMAVRAQIKDGPIPRDRIQLRFVQIVADYGGILTWADGSDAPLGLLAAGSGQAPDRCQPPLLDMYGLDASTSPPFFRSGGRPLPVETGPERTARLWDSPGLSGLVPVDPHGVALTGVDAHWSYRTYLGCTVIDDVRYGPDYFETIQTVDWNARLAATIGGTGSIEPRVEAVGSLSRANAQRPVASTQRPAPLGPPTFNQCGRVSATPGTAVP